MEPTLVISCPLQSLFHRGVELFHWHEIVRGYVGGIILGQQKKQTENLRATLAQAHWHEPSGFGQTAGDSVMP
jgi:hypothetical protein